MAQRHINTKNGLITMPTGFAGVFQSFEVDESYAIDDVTIYDASLDYAQFLSNATPAQRVTVNGFVQHGAASMNPGFGAGTDHDGAAATFQYDTNSTITGNYLLGRLRTMHSRSRAACPATWEFANGGDIDSSTWATS